MDDWCARTVLLLGEETVGRFKDTHVLIVGVGGVGSAAAEMLARAGIGKFTLLDGDTVNSTNLNRQLLALHQTIGQSKVTAMAARIKAINPSVELVLRAEFMTDKDALALLGSDTFDFVIDAIDTLSPKLALLEACYRQHLPVISAMGAGGKIDPAQIRLADVSNTVQCPLAKAVRKGLRDKGILKGIPVVYSTEPVVKESVLPVSEERNKRSTIGTVSYMPVLFGCYMASYIIRTLSNKS